MINRNAMGNRKGRDELLTAKDAKMFDSKGRDELLTAKDAMMFDSEGRDELLTAKDAMKLFIKKLCVLRGKHTFVSFAVTKKN